MNSYIYVFFKKDALKSKDFKLERGSFRLKGIFMGLRCLEKIMENYTLWSMALTASYQMV